jgi:hypothetical protein
MAAVRTGLVHALLAVLLVVLVVGALALRSGGAGDPADEVTVPDPDPRTPVVAAAVSIVRPPGTVVLNTTERKLGAATGRVLPRREAEVLDRFGRVLVKAVVTRDDGHTLGVWQLSVPDRSNPHDAARALDELYAASGWDTGQGAVAGVLLRTQSPRQDRPLTAYRAHYVTGPHVIRVESYGPDAARTERAFAELLDRQLSTWPADR